MKTIQASASFTDEQVLCIQRHLQRKLWWLCKEYDTPPTNIYNIDETMVPLVHFLTKAGVRKEEHLNHS
eukprot:3793350-Amphidinium_carterae.1